MKTKTRWFWYFLTWRCTKNFSKIKNVFKILLQSKVSQISIRLGIWLWLCKQCKQNNIPIIGGNVSLYNSTNNNCIKPTINLVMLGIID